MEKALELSRDPQQSDLSQLFRIAGIDGSSILAIMNDP